MPITIQVPMNAPVNLPFPVGRPPSVTYIEISENGRSATSVPVYGVLDGIHVLDGGDALFGPTGASLHRDMVFHASGAQVSAANPAHGGEALTIYAVGLQTVTGLQVPTGTAPDVAVAAEPPTVSFDFAVDAGPSVPNASATSAQANYAGWVPGFVGLFQVNVVVPTVPADTALSNADLPDRKPDAIYSNLTVNLLGASSNDGAKICVTP